LKELFPRKTPLGNTWETMMWVHLLAATLVAK